MAEGHLARQAEQHIEADADGCAERHQREDEMRIAFGVKHQRNPGDSQDQDRKGDGRRGAKLHDDQTFLTRARPNNPLGISASAIMTTLNATICV